MSEMIWINSASFISASWGILITCLVCFGMEQLECPPCPLSYFLFFFWQRKMRASTYLCLGNGLWKCSQFSIAGKNRKKRTLIALASRSRSAVPQHACVLFCVVDSHFVHCIFIWRCQRIPTRPDPSPAKSPCQESSWQQVRLLQRCAFEAVRL